jgi:hypothetical protein
MRVVLLGLALFTAGSLARQADTPGRLIEAPEEYTYGCNAADAKPVAFRDLQRSPAAFLRQCVRVEGVSPVGREFYADEGDVYRHLTQLVEGDVQGIGIGLYSSKRSIIELGERARIEVIGRAFSCSEVYREAKEAQDEKSADSRMPVPPPMLLGYCHFYGDAIIYVARSRIISRGPLRLTGTAAARSFGDLDDLPPTDERYSDVWKRATQWLDAIRRPSSAQFDNFVVDHCGTATPATEEDRAAIHACRATLEQRVSFLQSRRLPPIKFYLRRTKPLYGPPNDYLALGCVCGVATCEALWPIHSIDTDSSAWPYLCAHVHREGPDFKVD